MHMRPPSPLSRVPLLAYVCGGLALIALIILVTTVPDPGLAPPPAATSPALPSPLGVNAPDPSAAVPDTLTGPPGTQFTISDPGDGTSYTVSVAEVTPVKPAGYYPVAPGHALWGALVDLTGLEGRPTGDAYLTLAVTGTDGEVYTPWVGEVTAGTSFDGGAFALHPGAEVSGWVAFELPSGTGPAEATWSASLDATCTWTLP